MTALSIYLPVVQWLMHSTVHGMYTKQDETCTSIACVGLRTHSNRNLRQTLRYWFSNMASKHMQITDAIHVENNQRLLARNRSAKSTAVADSIVDICHRTGHVFQPSTTDQSSGICRYLISLMGRVKAF